jgi:ubiquitin-conjugating enzyme E2 R
VIVVAVVLHSDISLLQVELRKNPEAYRKKVRKLVEKSLKELPKGFEMPKPKKFVPEKQDSFDDLLADDDYLEDAADYGSDDDEDAMDEDDDGGTLSSQCDD